VQVELWTKAWFPPNATNATNAIKYATNAPDATAKTQGWKRSLRPFRRLRSLRYVRCVAYVACVWCKRRLTLCRICGGDVQNLVSRRERVAPVKCSSSYTKTASSSGIPISSVNTQTDTYIYRYRTRRITSVGLIWFYEIRYDAERCTVSVTRDPYIMSNRSVAITRRLASNFAVIKSSFSVRLYSFVTMCFICNLFTYLPVSRLVILKNTCCWGQ